LSTGFTAGEQNWQARLGKLRDVVRQEVVARQLERELAPGPVRIIDLGCGQGTQALRLARRGYHVTGVDASADLLARFERDLAAERAGVRGRVRVERGLLEDYAERAGVSRFPAVLCHGVLMYSADPGPALRTIAALTAPGGMVSLLVRNGDALAMRPGLLGDWAACAEAFGSDRLPAVAAPAELLVDLDVVHPGHGPVTAGIRHRQPEPAYRALTGHQPEDQLAGPVGTVGKLPAQVAFRLAARLVGGQRSGLGDLGRILRREPGQPGLDLIRRGQAQSKFHGCHVL
jgi:S-adenosylmethionine-dependent methyltransferase